MFVLSELFLSLLWVIIALYLVWYFLLTDRDSVLALAEKFGKPVSDYAGKVSKDLLQNVKEECINRSHGKLTKEDILVLSFDISKLDYHKDYVENAVNHFGKIDVLINNAARYQIGEIFKTDTEVDKTLFNVNYFGPLSLSKLVGKQFLQQGGGHFVIISSIAGKFGIPSTASYCGTKHALQGYFDTVRMEYQRYNITVTTIVPGIFSSSIFEKTITTSTDKILEKDYDHYECTNMTSERCAHLSLVASVNKLYESWVAYQPFLFMLWASQYLPDINKFIMNIIYSKRRISQLYAGKWPNDLPVWRPLTQKKTKPVTCK
ncbi:hypothetical protein CEXT_164451 [Caerostris extrusa]|uniref:Dehydrogenase/reductase SDR family member 7 n=1 Tax=Caerostris extrusa TaxID=172846 RepID=A0AAV4P2G8_CAEEX|nr:hypothetical protein CEXT_164451 [Caerostris extrusa]